VVLQLFRVTGASHHVRVLEGFRAISSVLMTFNMGFSTKKCAGGGREIAFGRMLERELHLGSLLGMLLDGDEREREREQLPRVFAMRQCLPHHHQCRKFNCCV
jgi:hypothetical protein